MRYRFCKLLMIIACIFIAACSSVGNKYHSSAKSIPPELSFLPADVNVTMVDAVDIQLALSKRNLYLNDLSTIKPIQRKQCPIEISAHRGDYRQVESSSWSIKAALFNGFNSVEIDIMRLGDGTWVHYHDPYTGRTAVHQTGKRMKVERMSSSDWGGLRLRSKSNGDLLSIRPNTAIETFRVFAANAKPGQKLNVEIKSDANGNEFKIIDRALQRTVGAGNYYYSSMKLDVLIKLRGINKTVYLGFIQRPHSNSINKLKKDLRKAGKNDKFYLAHKSSIEWWGNVASYAYRNKRYKNYVSTNSLKKLVDDLGPNSGLHLDIRSYTSNIQVKSRAANLGMKVFSYSINGPDYHEQQLLKIKQQSLSLLPNGVIVDQSPYHICQRLFGTANKQENYVGLTAAGRYINSLPNNADMDRLYDSLTYMDSGYYFDFGGKLSAIKSPRKVSSRQVVFSHRRTIIDDEALNFNNGKAIQIILERNNE